MAEGRGKTVACSVRETEEEWDGGTAGGGGVDRDGMMDNRKNRRSKWKNGRNSGQRTNDDGKGMVQNDRWQ